MKKLIALALFASISCSALAQPGHHHHHNHGGSANWAGPLIGGIILGGILSQTTRPSVVVPPPVVYYPPVVTFPPIFQPNCRQELASQFDQYGREYRYPVTICN